MSMHYVPMGEPHEIGVGCSCRPTVELRTWRGKDRPVIRHRSSLERFQGAAAMVRPARKPAGDSGG